MPAPKLDHHFFATSAGSWLTTSKTRDLRALLREMDRDGLQYSLWLVPGPYDADYEIECYRPMVEGAKLLAVFHP